MVEQRLPGGLTGQGHRGGLDEVELLGLAGQRVGPGGGECGVGPSSRCIAIHRLALTEAGHVLADSLDDTGEIAPWNPGKTDGHHLPKPAGGKLVIDRIDRSGPNAHEHLSLAGLRHGRVLVAQLLGTAISVDANGFHHDVASSQLGLWFALA